MSTHSTREASKEVRSEAHTVLSAMGNCNNIWWRIRVTMDLFQHRYYRTSAILSMITGQWPYLSTPVRRCFLLMIFLGLVSQLVPQLMAIVKHHDDWEFILESASPLILNATILIKLVCSLWNSQKMLKLLNRIRTDWQVWGQDQEVNIIHDYAEQGKKMTIVYSVAVVSTCILFGTRPIVPKIVDVLLKNGSEPGEFAFPGYYFVDEQKYYFYISIYTFMCITGGGFVTIAIDNMFIVYMQHGCGLFSAVGHKLQRTGKNKRSAASGEMARASIKRDIDFEHLVWCIDRHNDAIEYTKLIEATYSWCLFLLVGCNMLITSIAGFQIVKKAKDPRESVTLIAVLLAEMGHLYMESSMSQILIDHSTDICSSIHNGKWYRLSQASQKLLVLMMMRCNQSCKLTAGKMLTMSIKSFVTILHTSLSYFTLLRSV